MQQQQQERAQQQRQQNRQQEIFSKMLGVLRLVPQITCASSKTKGSLFIGCQHFSTTQNLREIRKMARLRVVDNSSIGRAAMAAGKPPRCIHVYTKTGVGHLGDKVLVAIKGQKKRGYLVGLKQKQKAFVPRFDSNNIVLVEDNGMPCGTRIKAPIPSVLRGKSGDFTKLLALATRFV